MLHRQVQSTLEIIGAAFTFAKAKKERERERVLIQEGGGGRRKRISSLEGFHVSPPRPSDKYNIKIFIVTPCMLSNHSIIIPTNALI